MRISILENREDFHKILSETLREWSFTGDALKEKPRKFYINKYLNFIAHPDLPEEYFSNLVSEYGTSTTMWKSLVHKTYVKLAVKKSLRKIFSHKSTELPQRYTESLILGGNHRLRLIQKGLDSSLIVLKKGEDRNFISNDISLRTGIDLDYAPTVINYGSDWLEEAYVKGLPLNRIKDFAAKETIVEKILSEHFNHLIRPSLVTLSVEEYLELNNEKLNQKLFDYKLKINKNAQTEIRNIFIAIASKLEDKEISISWSHGDFQEGNVLVNNGRYKVIDWEAANKRFWLYDAFVFLGKIREHGNFKDAILRFGVLAQSKNDLFKLPPDWQELLMIEEILYNVNEDCSPNYYQSGLKALHVTEQIKKYYLV